MTGTDIGWPFEHGNGLHFLFGDTRDFDPDLWSRPTAAPARNKTESSAGQPRDAYASWLRFHGDAAENMASTALAFDPEQCIALTAATELRAGTFAHVVSSTTVDPATQLSAPAVAALPQDRFVVASGNRIVVVTDDRRVFAHEVLGDTVRFARQLGTISTANAFNRVVPYQTRSRCWR